MNIYRKICVLLSKKKTIGGTNFCKKKKKKKKSVKVQVFSISLNQKRSNTYNQSIKKKMVTQNILVKSKLCFLVRLQINLLIFMRIAIERDNVMLLYGWSMPYTWPPFMLFDVNTHTHKHTHTLSFHLSI